VLKGSHSHCKSTGHMQSYHGTPQHMRVVSSSSQRCRIKTDVGNRITNGRQQRSNIPRLLTAIITTTAQQHDGVGSSACNEQIEKHSAKVTNSSSPPRPLRTLDKLRGLARIVRLTVNVATVSVWAEDTVKLASVVARAVNFAILFPPTHTTTV
jgi:hypothetical protein